MQVILADDHVSIRSSLRLLLSQEPALSVVGEAADAQGLRRLLLDDEQVTVLSFSRKQYELEEIFMQIVEGDNHGTQ